MHVPAPFGGWTAANSRLRRSGGARNLYRNLHATALLISITSHRIEMYDLYWLERSGLKLVQAWESPKFQRHFWIVCKGVKQFSTPDSAVPKRFHPFSGDQVRVRELIEKLPAYSLGATTCI